MSNVGKILSLLVVKWTVGRSANPGYFRRFQSGPDKDYKLVFHTLAFLIKLT